MAEVCKPETAVWFHVRTSGKKLLFMGGEFGQWDEWDFDHSLDWHLLQYEPHQKLQHYIRDLNRLYRIEPPLYEIDFDYSGFEWIDFHDTEQSVISFIRKGKRADDFLVVCVQFYSFAEI